MASFPLVGHTISVNPNGASVQVTGISRGVLYRVVADVACYLQYNAAAAAGAGMYIPPNFPQDFMFGMADSQGTDLKVFVFAAAGTTKIYFTPIMPAAMG
jgi:hypothetical protein